MSERIITDESVIARIVRGTEFEGFLPKDYVVRLDEMVIPIEDGKPTETITQDRIEGVGGGMRGFFKRKFDVGRDLELLVVSSTERIIEVDYTTKSADTDDIHITGPLSFTVDRDHVAALYGLTSVKGGTTLRVDDLRQRLEGELTKVFSHRVRQIPSAGINDRAVIDELRAAAHTELHKTLSMWGLQLLDFTPNFNPTAEEEVMSELRREQLETQLETGRTREAGRRRAAEHEDTLTQVQERGEVEQTEQAMSDRLEAQRLEEDIRRRRMEDRYTQASTIEEATTQDTVERMDLEREKEEDDHLLGLAERGLEMVTTMKDAEAQREVYKKKAEADHQVELARIQAETDRFRARMEADKARYSVEDWERAFERMEGFFTEKERILNERARAMKQGTPAVYAPTRVDMGPSEGPPTTSGRRCDCGNINRPTARFCDRCGQALE